MKDGLYRIETNRFVAGFVVVNGKIVAIAPILRSWSLDALKVFGRWIRE